MAIRPSALITPAARKTGALLLTSAVLSGFALVSAAPARADIQADIRAAQAQLTKSREQTEAITEKFNAAQLQLRQARRSQAAAQGAVDLANTQAEASRGELAAFAANAYRTGGLDPVTVLVSGDPQTFLDRSASLNLLSRREAAVIRKVRVVAHDQAQAQAVAADAGRRAQTILNGLSSQRRAISAGIARQEALLNTLVSRQQQLVAQARDAASRAAAQARVTALGAEASSARSASAVFNTGSGSQPAPSAAGGSGGVATALDWARREMGKPYVYGAAGPDSFDCSGLTQYVFGKGGIALDHYTGSQWNTGRHVERGELQPGDLVFFYSDMHHVGIYVGGGQMIDAPHSGANVRQEDVWWGDYVGAVRVTG